MEHEVFSKLLEVLLETIITVALPIVLTNLVVWINAQVKNTKAKMSKEQLDLVYLLINQFVRAAEQAGLTGALKKAGAEKKAYVMALLKSELEGRKININLEVLDAMVEAAVNDAFSKIDLDPELPVAG